MKNAPSTDRTKVLRRWPSAKCVKHFDVDLFCIYTGPKGRGISTPRSGWRSTRFLAWADAAEHARNRTHAR